MVRDLQIAIIAGCLGEGNFRRVSFLRDEDFTNYPDFKFRVIWKLIREARGSIPVVGKNIYARSEKIWRSITQLQNMATYSYIEIMALKLLEIRYREYLIEILDKMGSNEDPVKAALIINTKIEVRDKTHIDIFDTIENTPEYLGAFLSDEELSRLRDLQQYVVLRAEEIKKVTNEFRKVYIG